MLSQAADVEVNTPQPGTVPCTKIPQSSKSDLSNAKTANPIKLG